LLVAHTAAVHLLLLLVLEQLEVVLRLARLHHLLLSLVSRELHLQAHLVHHLVLVRLELAGRVRHELRLIRLLVGLGLLHGLLRLRLLEVEQVTRKHVLSGLRHCYACALIIVLKESVQVECWLARWLLSLLWCWLVCKCEIKPCRSFILRRLIEIELLLRLGLLAIVGGQTIKNIAEATFEF